MSSSVPGIGAALSAPVWIAVLFFVVTAWVVDEESWNRRRNRRGATSDARSSNHPARRSKALTWPTSTALI
jgi:hypothetical protein